MCGIVGVFGLLDGKIEKAFEDMLQWDVVRGMDSTGVALLKRLDTVPVILKSIMLPTDLICSKEYQKETKQYNRLMIGHNRAATKGKVNNKNAHPFQHGPITLVHNGTLWRFKHLVKEKEFDTDSETITKAIANEGIEELWKKLDGAAQLVWWNSDELTLNFLGNEKRSFWYAKAKSGDVVIFASEDWMIEVAAKRNKIELERNENGNACWRPLKNMHFKLSYDLSKGMTIETQELEAYSPPTTRIHRTTGGYSDYYWGRNEKSTLYLPYSNSKHLLHKKSTEKITDKKMSLKEFREKFVECCLCGASLHDEEEYKNSVILHEDNGQCACSDCVSTADKFDIRLVH